MRIRLSNDWAWRRDAVIIAAVYFDGDGIELTLCNFTIEIGWGW